MNLQQPISNLLAVVSPYKFSEIRSVVKVTAGCGLAKRNITAQCQHVVYAVSQILIQLFFNSFFCVFDNGEMSNRVVGSAFNNLTYFTVCSDVSAACSVCTGNVRRLYFIRWSNGTRQILQSLLCLLAGKLPPKEQRSVFFKSLLKVS